MRRRSPEPRPVRYHQGRSLHRREPRSPARWCIPAPRPRSRSDRHRPARAHPASGRQPLLSAGRVEGRGAAIGLRGPGADGDGGGKNLHRPWLPASGESLGVSRSQLGRMARRDLGVGCRERFAPEPPLRWRVRTRRHHLPVLPDPGGLAWRPAGAALRSNRLPARGEFPSFAIFPDRCARRGHRPPGGDRSPRPFHRYERGGTFRRTFVQMRGAYTLRGKLSGRALSDEGEGFFETYLTR